MLRVGVIGVTGYSGMELLRLLVRHEFVKVTYLANRSGLEENLSLLAKFNLPRVEAFDADTCIDKCDVVFVALPSGSAGDVARLLWSAGVSVVDLSGDLRLPAAVYEEWYGRASQPHEFIDEAKYGLTEWRRESLRGSRLVSNPGCFATAVSIGVLPLTEQGLVDVRAPIIVDAKSGITGAGKSPTARTSLAELHENFYAYKPARHQHTPEIERTIGIPDVRVVLTTQVLPIPRGIYACSYLQLKETCDENDLNNAFRCYEGESFVRVLPNAKMPDLIDTRGTNECHIRVVYHARTHTAQVVTALDNLLKGAAGQAIQNMNVMNGLPEDTGLSLLPVFP